jgi:hypothetical protein
LLQRMILLLPLLTLCNRGSPSLTTPGVTELRHDKPDPVDVQPCQSADCFALDLTYAGYSMSQMTALIKLSSSCSQLIKVRT